MRSIYRQKSKFTSFLQGQFQLVLVGPSFMGSHRFWSLCLLFQYLCQITGQSHLLFRDLISSHQASQLRPLRSCPSAWSLCELWREESSLAQSYQDGISIGVWPWMGLTFLFESGMQPGVERWCLPGFIAPHQLAGGSCGQEGFWKPGVPFVPFPIWDIL